TPFHSAAEKFEKEFREPSKEEMVQLFSDQYSALVNKAMQKEPDLNRWLTAGGKPAGEDIEERYRLGQRQVAQYVDWSTENQPYIWYDSEGWNGLDISEADGYAPGQGVELYFMAERGAVMVRGVIGRCVSESAGSVR